MYAYEELKRAQYFFEYLRTTEKLYKHDLQKEESETAEPEQVHEEKTPLGTATGTSTEKKLSAQETEKLVLNQSTVQNQQQERQEASKTERYNKFREEFKDLFEI